MWWFFKSSQSYFRGGWWEERSRERENFKQALHPAQGPLQSSVLQLWAKSRVRHLTNWVTQVSQNPHSLIQLQNPVLKLSQTSFVPRILIICTYHRLLESLNTNDHELRTESANITQSTSFYLMAAGKKKKIPILSHLLANKHNNDEIS